jgi:hypothetical protein
MMVPDFTLIAEIMMFSEGFQTAKVLAKKMIAIMELSQQQLSKQDHYDYGLRSFVIPIARAAGALKRGDPDASEEVIMYRTMIDLIKPKLVFLDLPLFMALLSDLFPGVELPASDGGELRKALEADLLENNLQIVPEFLVKIIQIFDCKVARHGNMIVGKTGSGKSVAWQTLTRAMKALKCAPTLHLPLPTSFHFTTISLLAPCDLCGIGTRGDAPFPLRIEFPSHPRHRLNGGRCSEPSSVAAPKPFVTNTFNGSESSRGRSVLSCSETIYDGRLRNQSGQSRHRAAPKPST